MRLLYAEQAGIDSMELDLRYEAECGICEADKVEVIDQALS